MRRALTALYIAIMVIAPMPFIGAPDTTGGSLLIAAIALVAVFLGAVSVTGALPWYGPEVAILAVVPLVVALMGEGAYSMLWTIPLQVVFGVQLASGSHRPPRSDLACHGEERDDDHDEADHDEAA